MLESGITLRDMRRVRGWQACDSLPTKRHRPNGAGQVKFGQPASDSPLYLQIYRSRKVPCSIAFYQKRIEALVCLLFSYSSQIALAQHANTMAPKTEYVHKQTEAHGREPY
jgi:hypothetical protein